MTVGKDTGQMGNCLPLSGNAEIRQGSSAADGLTITLSSGVNSTSGGQGIVVRRNQTAGTSGGTELFVTEYAGTRGYRKVKALTSAATSGVQRLSVDDAGSFLILPTVTTTGSSDQSWTLPANEQGLWYEIYAPAAIATGVIRINAPSCGGMIVFDDSAADALAFNKASGAVTIGGSARFYSDGSKWHAISQASWTSGAPTSATMTSFNIIS